LSLAGLKPGGRNRPIHICMTCRTHMAAVAAATASALLAVTSAVSVITGDHISSDSDIIEADFSKFVKKYGRSYKQGTEEYAARKALFTQRFFAVKAQNSKPGKLWRAGIGRFADFTEGERRAMRGWRRIGSPRGADSILAKGEAKPLPENVSWTHLKTASNIRDQAACGSCWAITTVSVLEAHYEIYHEKKKSFSAQQLLDCTPNPQECGGQGGCKGATVELGMAWILKNGIASEENEPYVGQDKKCTHPNVKKDDDEDEDEDENEPQTQVLAMSKQSHTPRRSQVMTSMNIGLHSWATLTQNVEQPLAEAVAQYGPVAISAAASDWFEYEGGVFDGCNKDVVVDHAITLYGYGVDRDSNKKYWLIRNSWGPDWGEKGFIRMLRHEKGEKYCGTDNDPSQGTGCKGGPEQVTVCGMCGMLWDSVVPYFATGPSAHPTGEAADEAPSEEHHRHFQHNRVFGKESMLVRRES